MHETRNGGAMKKPLIGIVGPFTGPRSCYGELLVHTVKQSKYIDVFDFVFKDDQADEDIARRVACELVSSNVNAILGHFNSRSAYAALEIYPSNLPVILPAATAVNLKDFPNAYRICATDLDQASVIMHTLQKIHYRQCYIWTDSSIYSRSINEYLTIHSGLAFSKNLVLQDNDLIICLGSHINVATRLKNLKFIGNIAAICCDDCSIAEFDTLISEMSNINRLQVLPVPSYTECIVVGMQTLYELLYLRVPPTYQKNNAAKFEISQLCF